LVSEGISPGRVDVISNMVQPPSEANKSELGEYVGFVGRMSPEKGTDVLFEAARQCPEIPFKIAGEVGQRQPNGTIPRNVELLGHLGPDALDAFYRQCRFVIVPSLWYEGFPSVIIEAMRLAKPVIASRIGGLPEIVDDKETGLLFEPGDADGLVRNVNKLWDDPIAVMKLGAAGQEKVANDYIPELYYEKLMAVYAAAISETAGQRQSKVQEHP
jgi:glycosyltransferase involved in cell wall biosynthesis